MTSNGKTIPIFVSGEQDKSFDPQDFVEFYATAIQSPSTDLQIHWLTISRKQGKRIKTSSVNDPTLPSIGSFVDVAEVRPRTIYFAALLNGDDENFFGPLINTTPVDQSLELKNIDAASSEDALLEIGVQGVTDLADQNPDHLIHVKLNGLDVGSFTYDGRSGAIHSFSIPHSWLMENSNVISLSSGSDQDFSLVDFVRIRYRRNLIADAGRLKVDVPGNSNVRIDGFSSQDIRVLETTSSDAPRFVNGFIEQSPAGYAINFSTEPGTERSYIALEGAATLKPDSIESHQQSSWRNYHGARIVLIVRKDWVSSLQPLRDLRSSQGKSTAIVPLEDIYNEFSDGIETPEAIRDFLSHAKRSWSEKAKFVLLAGDATFDPKNYLGFGDLDIIPTKLVDTSTLETASDDWFSDFDNDGIANLPTGRLPARAQQELDLMVSKIIQTETGGSEDWRSEALLVSDSNGIFDFELAAAEIENQLNGVITSTKILRGQMEPDAARANVLSEINRGHVLVNYIGHGSVQGWSSQQLLTSADALQLANGGRLPFFVNMTCYNGFFHDLYTYSLSEALLSAQSGGAAAVWASSGLTPPPDQHVLNRELIRLLFGKKPYTIGEAVRKAKNSIQDPDIRKTWILFGDPAMRLRYIAPEPEPEGD
jgi:hypothetical protein